jgi:hypothetical protein
MDANIISSLGMAMIGPVSAWTLMLCLARHESLAPNSVEDHTIAERFGSEQALHAYESQVREIHRRRVIDAMRRYALTFRLRAAAGDPRRTEQLQASLRLSEAAFFGESPATIDPVSPPAEEPMRPSRLPRAVGSRE